MNEHQEAATSGPAAVESAVDPAVDPAVLDGLTARLGERGAAFRATLLDTWRTETDRRLLELTAAVEAGDRDGVMRVAHTLKSSSAALGAGPLAATCHEIENRLRGRGAADSADLAADAADILRHTDLTAAAFSALW